MLSKSVVNNCNAVLIPIVGFSIPMELQINVLFPCAKNTEDNLFKANLGTVLNDAFLMNTACEVFS